MVAGFDHREAGRLQARARGMLVRRAQREERARWASAHDVAALVALQAALRGELFRRAFFQQFEALDAAVRALGLEKDQ